MEGSDAPNPYRLPSTVRPRRYELELRPDLDGATFEGSATITVDITEPTSSITLHALDLVIDSAEVESTSGHTAGIDATATVTADPDVEQIRLVLPGELPSGSAEIRLEFSGSLNDQLVGFYRSTFTSTDHSGTEHEHTIAVTQFESTHARRAFPCFDEPEFKAVFAISLVVPDDLLAVSNGTEIERVPRGNGFDRVRFADTIPMSTYLVAFVVGPLEATEPRIVAGSAGPIALRIVHPPGTGHLCGFALEVAEAALGFFESYYELPYPGDKIDLVAVPDFAFGAMENLGCVTFREVLLLIDPGTATQPELQRVADVINHELAHMWFGDLVTMSWWNGIWLNEAFATFMEVLATDSFRPDWDVWTTFGLARSAAFDTDALELTRPIEYEVVTAADAEGMFDILTYEKGASVVRMLEQYLGPDEFRRGIAAYLRRHAYGSTETTDLWDALEQATGEPVRRIMDHWIFRGGHPLILVEPTERGVRLTQQRFRYVGGRPAGGPGTGDGTTGEEPAWPVPMVVTTVDGGEEEHRVLLEEQAEIDLGARPSLVRANVGGNGFYRVDMTAELRRSLASTPPVSALERFVLVDDAWAALLADRSGLDEVVDLLRLLGSTETDTSVWKRISSALRRVAHLAGPSHAGRTAALIREIAGPALDRVDELLDGPPLVDGSEAARFRELRGVVFSLLGHPGGDETVHERAVSIFNDATDTDAPLGAAAIEVVAACATEEQHRELERRWQSATTPQEELRYLNALVDTPDNDAFDRALRLAATEVRTQNAPYLIRRALTHPTFDRRAWQFVEERWDELTARFPSNSLPRMLEGVRSIADRATAESVESFLSTRSLRTGGRQVGQHLERMWVSVAAGERVRAALGDEPQDARA
jgi:puromycin-sensitive aminopeptidase